MAIPVHPGRMIKRELKARRVSGHKLALELRVPPDRISKILNGKRGITADTALRLGRYFGNGPRIWDGPAIRLRPRRRRNGERQGNQTQRSRRGLSQNPITACA